LASTDAAALKDTLRPEVRLLLATAGGPEVDPEITRLATGPLDWIRFLQSTAGERAEAIVAARFKRLGVQLPENLQRELSVMATRSDLRMTTLSFRLDQTLAALAQADIRVLLLKGAALGRTLYGSLPRRPMLDLDLLVPAGQRDRAREVALATGWAPSEWESQVEYYRGHYHAAPLRDGQGRSFNLELHTALFQEGHPFNWPLEGIWDRSVALEHSAARVPSPEDLLLHIALHFSWSHLARFGPWRAFRDIKVMIDAAVVDWDGFTRLAHSSRGASAAYWTLRLARLTAGVSVPPEVERALRPSVPDSVLPMLDRHFAGQWCVAESACPSERLGQWLWRLAVRPRQSGHGTALPWMRDALFVNPHAPPSPESVSHKLARHLANSGRYVQYLRRLATGTAPVASLTDSERRMAGGTPSTLP
jgi:hypothetical protein